MKSSVLKSLVLFLFFICFSWTKINAQCPPQFDPWQDTPWVNAGCHLILVDYNGTLCWTNVCYCYRNVGVSAPFTEVYVYSHVLEDPDCVNLSFEQRQKLIGVHLIKYNPQGYNWPCPPCPGETANYHLYTGACFDGDGNQCENGHTYCRQTYMVCCNSQTGEKIITAVGSPITIGTDCPDGCGPSCN